jgi:hypothetical protein
MRALSVFLVVLVVAALSGALALRAFQAVAEKRFGRTHAALAIEGEGTFSKAHLDGLDGAARRYLEHALTDGATLAGSVDLRFGGTLRTERGGEPLPLDATARIAPGHGYLIALEIAEAGVEGLESYAAGRAEARYVRHGFLPATDDGDHLDRSSRARFALEHVLIPSSLLPAAGVEWRNVDEQVAIARLRIDGEDLELTIRVDAEGRLLDARVPRHAALDRGGAFAVVPFVLEAAAERTYSGHTIPSEYRLAYHPTRGDAIEVARPIVIEATYR